MSRIGRHLLVASAAIAFVTGCASTMHVGAPPRTDRLKELTVAVSSTQDVIVALGEPRGTGAAYRTGFGEPRRVLYYEYTEADGVRISLKLLLVFIHDDRYDGHLWFSSAQLVEEVQR